MDFPLPRLRLRFGRLGSTRTRFFWHRRCGFPASPALRRVCSLANQQVIDAEAMGKRLLIKLGSPFINKPHLDAVIFLRHNFSRWLNR